MPTLADQRLLEILDKWLRSLELHERYTGLDNDSYLRVQPWPEHERPSRWVIDIARQKTLALKALLEERIKRGDAQFSEALELMTFLANLVGSEHIERFIPLATPENERPLRRVAADATPPAGSSASRAPPPLTPDTTRLRAKGHGSARAAPPPRAGRDADRPAAAAATSPAAPVSHAPDTAPTREMPMAPITSDIGSTDTRETLRVAVTATREMPQFAVPRPRSPAPAGTAHVARTERRSSASRGPAAGGARSSPKASAKHPARMPAATRPPGAGSASSAVRDHTSAQVIADAVRLMQWGRKWYELAELIARMADRPPVGEVRRILKDNKTAIEKKAGRD